MNVQSATFNLMIGLAFLKIRQICQSILESKIDD